MMYSNYQLENNPSFKMTGKEFNTLVKDIIPWALVYSMNCGKTCFDCSHKELLKMEG